jgi:hypothetical protein
VDFVRLRHRVESQAGSPLALGLTINFCGGIDFYYNDK